MAYTTSAAERAQRPVYQKTFEQYAASSDIDTEFEEDGTSDSDDYQGRRSEESFGNTTVSTYEELRTPASNDFRGFNFGLPVKPEIQQHSSSHDQPVYPIKSVEGPSGPHLFRQSQDSFTQPVEIYLEWSPIEGSKHDVARKSPPNDMSAASAPPSSVPLETWTTYQVMAWMRSQGFEEAVVQQFRMNDISGSLLQHLQFGDLKELGITSFGQRHILWDAIRHLRGGLSILATPGDEYFPTSPPPMLDSTRISPPQECSEPSTPEGSKVRMPQLARRRARRALRPDDIISPAESASIVAIEQLLPEPHHCSKGEACAKWRKYKRRMDKIAREFPLEMEQLEEVNASPITESLTIRPTSEAVPSVVASSDLLGPGLCPALRLDEGVLRDVKNRDPQENVRQFLTFQHMAELAPVEPTTPPYEMFPPLNPPMTTPAPHEHLQRLPKLQIPPSADSLHIADHDRTAVQEYRSPITAIQADGQEIYRFASPASAMDVPLVGMPAGPVERDVSNSVPPDMRYGVARISQSLSRANSTNIAPSFPHGFQPLPRSQSTTPLERATSPASFSSSHRRTHRRGSSFAPLSHLSPIDDADEKTPTASCTTSGTSDTHAGWMRKRRTKLLRHEWQESHFRLKGTTLNMHRDATKLAPALESIDVDDYAVACSSLASNKLNAALKSLRVSKKSGSTSTAFSGSTSNDKNASDASAFTFQLVPAVDKRGILGAAVGKTHHFAVRNRDQRIDWMRELMLAKALHRKAEEGCVVLRNGEAVAS